MKPEIEESKIIEYKVKEIDGFNGYFVDTDGNVFSEKKHCHYHKVKLKPQLSTNKKYLIIGLIRNGKHNTKLVHKLVAEAFIENNHNKPMVLHRDGNGHNPKVKNLYWGTGSENSFDAVRHGTAPGLKNKGENNGRTKLNEYQVRVIKHMEKYKEYKPKLSAVMVGKMFGVTSAQILYLWKGQSWKHITV